MTLKRAEVITGLRIETGLDSAGPFAQAFDGEVLFKLARGKSLKLALGKLVEDIYRESCQKVFAEQGWKCAGCGQFRPLQGHHKKHRSKGRVDEGNLEGLCAACHSKEHGG